MCGLGGGELGHRRFERRTAPGDRAAAAAFQRQQARGLELGGHVGE